MPHLAAYIALADHSEQTLAYSLRAVAQDHARVADVFHTAHLLAGWSDDHRKHSRPVIERYGEADVDEPERLHATGLAETREGEIGLLRDLQDLHVLATLTVLEVGSPPPVGAGVRAAGLATNAVLPFLLCSSRTRHRARGRTSRSDAPSLEARGRGSSHSPCNRASGGVAVLWNGAMVAPR